jgi:hypothetical protein
MYRQSNVKCQQKICLKVRKIRKYFSPKKFRKKIFLTKMKFFTSQIIFSFLAIENKKIPERNRYVNEVQLQAIYAEEKIGNNPYQSGK